MRILVIDDTKVNLLAAKQTLHGHDLTVVSTYDEAVSLLEPRVDQNLLARKMATAGFPATSDGLKGKTQDAWWDAREKLQKESMVPYWDAVLCDLLMPAGRDAQGKSGLEFVGTLMPVGFALALMAAKNGAKYIAVVTATNHHCHPASAMLDRLSSAYWNDSATADFVINGAKCGFFHHPSVVVEGFGQGKDWSKVLTALTRA